ncbi:MAG: hypothetical protein WCH39_09650 [Schlesneria sp.]
MNAVEAFYVAIEKFVPNFRLDNCQEFNEITIKKTDSFGLEMGCTIVHSSSIQIVVEFLNVWNIEICFGGGSMALIEPFIEPSIASTAGREYFQFFDEMTKSRWYFETIRLVEVIPGGKEKGSGLNGTAEYVT